MREVNPQVWFGERELEHVPPHFIRCATAIDGESLEWVKSKLVGRYSLSTYVDDSNFFLDSHNYIYFEEPGDAMMYELRWAGSQNNSLY